MNAKNPKVIEKKVKNLLYTNRDNLRNVMLALCAASFLMFAGFADAASSGGSGGSSGGGAGASGSAGGSTGAGSISGSGTVSGSAATSGSNINGRVGIDSGLSTRARPIEPSGNREPLTSSGTTNNENETDVNSSTTSSGSTSDVNTDTRTRSDYGTGTAPGYVDPTGADNRTAPTGVQPGYVDPTGADNTNRTRVNPTSTTLPSASSTGSPRSGIYDTRNSSTRPSGTSGTDATTDTNVNSSTSVNPATGKISD